MHGRETRVPLAHGKQQAEFAVFPLYHPASIIYNRSLQAVYDEDLQVLKTLL
jgi:DNA polymerase